MSTRRSWCIRLVCALSAALPAAAQEISISPSTATVEASATRDFTATVLLTPNTLNWKVNGIAGGNASVGTVTATGLKVTYRAPAVVPAPNTVRLTATSTAFTSKSASVDITIIRPIPRITSISPSSFQTGIFNLTIAGSRFAGDALVVFDDEVLPAMYISPSQLRVTGNATRAGQSIIAVRLPGPGSVTSAGFPVQVTGSTSGLGGSLTISPSAVSVQAGLTRLFTASVSGTPGAPVTWAVNGIPGGNSQAGTISTAGLYTAPPTPPTPAQVTITATSLLDVTMSGTATVTVTLPPPPPPAITTLAPSSVESGKSFTITISGSGFAAGAKVRFAATEVAASSVTANSLSASSSTSAAAGTQIAVTVANPDGQISNSVNLAVTAPPTSSGGSGQGGTTGNGGVSYLTAARLLDQGAFGPTPSEIARVQQLGVAGWIDDQFNQPETQIPTTFGTDAGLLAGWQIWNFAHSKDQLRQRVAYSLGQILVVSRDKLIYADVMSPWLALLSKHAFGNYRNLLREMTILPSMGKYLDLANSTKPGVANGASENYPRELMQLFSIGLWKLNRDGTQTTTPTYDEATMRQVALALTGWTYPTKPGETAFTQNQEYFVGFMEPREESHDKTAKNFLGCSLPANQTVTQDLDGVINCLFLHPNMPPFIATRLIRSLVTSNPSGAYIDRVAAVFENNGSGVRGDLKAVVKAILTDSEARQDTATTDQGRLKEPMLHAMAFVRALNGQISPANTFAWSFENLGQSVLNPPSVFNWFSPLYRIPRTTRFGPEFQIYGAGQSMERANFFFNVLAAQFSDIKIDLTPFNSVAGNSTQLIDAVDKALLYGRMPAAMKASLLKVLNVTTATDQRVLATIGLTALSGHYTVQY